MEVGEVDRVESAVVDFFASSKSCAVRRAKRIFDEARVSRLV